MKRDALIQLLKETERVVLIGGPKTGKSTLAHQLERRQIRCTDELVGVLEWSEISDVVAATWFDEPGRYVLEGVATARALRKWLRANPGKLLGITIVLMQEAHGELTKGQAAMGKGVATVWNEIAPDALARGATVVKHDGTSQEPVRGTTPDAPAAGAVGSSP